MMKSLNQFGFGESIILFIKTIVGVLGEIIDETIQNRREVIINGEEKWPIKPLKNGWV